MQFAHLLAKSCSDPENPPFEATLAGHLSKVIRAALIIDDHVADALKEMMPAELSERMWHDALFCAAWLHDIGKANDHFQYMLRNNGIRQGVRHETMSFIIIETVFKAWLRKFWHNYPGWFKSAVLFSVAGHHLKFPDTAQRTGILKPEVIFLGAHPQMAQVLELGRVHFNLAETPFVGNTRYSLVAFETLEIKELRTRIERLLNIEFSPDHLRFIAMLKSMLMCADLAGSALPQKELDMENWLNKRLATLVKEDDLKLLIKQKIGQGRLKKFQQNISETARKTVFVEAGCGSGKTIAAYNWAARHAAEKKLFFCYPTTATASVGFSSYLYDPNLEALLVHSRVSVDYRLLKNMPPRNGVQRELLHLGLEAMDMWPASTIVCTAHTVLGLLQNTRRGIYGWPSLVRAAFVFDEIHSFSDLLFAHLLRFLQLFCHAPVLLMTATLPPFRKKALLKACECRGGVEIITGPQEREQAKRYLLSRSNDDNAWQQCLEMLNSGGKVLWICNTVARAMKVAQYAHDIGLPVQPYHSRYRYRDRLVRQRTVIEGFMPNQPAMLAVTTQVAEVSLDLSADLLISEYAPVPSLIQRLGRLNRFADHPERLAHALFLQPENGLPYAKDSEEDAFWKQIQSWLDDVADTLPKSQMDLHRAFLENAETESNIENVPYCDWLDDPARSETNRHAIMEPSYTVEIVREEDLTHALLAEMAIPMPFPRNKNWVWKSKGRYIIAPEGAIQYDSFRGGEYARELGFEII